jgi:hypothetical protein
MGGRVHTVEKNTEALVVASKETQLEVNADKTKYMVMSQDQNAECNYNIKTDNSSFVEQFRCLGTALVNPDSVLEEIKSRLKSGNTCYHSVQNILSSSLLPKNIKIKYTEL